LEQAAARQQTLVNRGSGNGLASNAVRQVSISIPRIVAGAIPKLPTALIDPELQPSPSWLRQRKESI